MAGVQPELRYGEMPPDSCEERQLALAGSACRGSEHAPSDWLRLLGEVCSPGSLCMEVGREGKKVP